MALDDRLALAMTTVMGLSLAGCDLFKDASGDDSGWRHLTREDMRAICDGAEPPGGVSLQEGYVVVAAGGACPEAADADARLSPCSRRDELGMTCRYLRTEEDQVLVDNGYGGYWADADPDTPPDAIKDRCVYEVLARWEGSICGRPLLADGRPVMAEPVASADWRRGPRPDVLALSRTDRQRVGEHWLEVARLEHASVASFAAFALDLMRLGAPPDLVAAAHRAALDEIDHAERCFALASAYLGRDVGPGPLAVPPVGRGTAADVAEALVREGCIGETLAALDAAARLARATDPAVRETLLVIARDESAHARLAWRALAWMLAADTTGTVEERVAAVFVESRPVPASCGAPSPANAHGWLDDATLAAAFDIGWRDVVHPGWAALHAA